MTKKSHPLYNTWFLMRLRCKSPKCNAYPNYGGRGITYCNRWDDFWAFVDDMGPRPDGHTLDRLDNDGDYKPSNCRWSTPKQQADNRRPDNGKFISQVPYGYRVAITIERNTRPHRKTFRTLDDAKSHLEVCKFERAVLRQFI